MKTQSIRRVALLILAAAAMLAALLASPAGAASASPSLLNERITFDQHLVDPLSTSSPASVISPLQHNRLFTLTESIVPNHYVVVLKDSVDNPRTVARRQTQQQNRHLGFVYNHALKGYSAVLSKGAVEALTNSPLIKYIVPDRKVEPFEQTIPTGIKRTYAATNTSLDIDGSDDVRVSADVAVIDTGIDYQHPDLNVVGRADCVPSPPNEVAECVDDVGTDGYGHGTHVAGIIGARDNNIGVVGVAPGARLWSVRALNNQGQAYESWLVAAVDWVTAHAAQVEVANMSIGCGPLVDEEHLEYKACEMPALDDALGASVGKGVVYVAAAGNSAVDAKYVSPAKNADVITVSALADYDGEAGGKAPTLSQEKGGHYCKDPVKGTEKNYGPDDTLASFSNYGDVVDVAAPGVCILSTVPTGGSFISEETGEETYARISGTSMAAPHVAGAAAILASKYNPNDLEDVEAIRQTIVEDGNQSWAEGEREPILDISNGADFSAVSAEPVITNPVDHSTLHGEVNPMGLSTNYYFEYGTTTSYGSVTATESAGSGGKFIPVEKELTGLSGGGTVYHFRLVATNSANETFHGADRTFSITPPSADTGLASDVVGWGARLHADINPSGMATQYYFQYGETTSYGYSTANSPKNLSAGTAKVNASQWIGSLEPGATYHYRVVAKNAAGEDLGEDQTLTTPPAEWQVQATPDPDPELGTPPYQALLGVSCSSANYCMAVGQGGDPKNFALGSWSFAERWDGSEWSYVSWPKVAEEDPEYGTQIANEWVQDVDCSSPQWCVAVGLVALKEGKGRRVFIDHWDGEKWTMDTAVADLVGTHDDAVLAEVSCMSASMCFVVGQYRDGGETLETIESIKSIGLKWNGEKWSTEPMPAPEGSDWTWLTGVNCLSGTSCIAFGGHLRLEPFLMQEMSLLWNGEEWSVNSAGYPFSGFPVAHLASCFDSGSAVPRCWAPGGGLQGVEYFDGAVWGGESAPIDGFDPLEAYSQLINISCLHWTRCAAAGEQYVVGENEWLPVAAMWNGSEWSRQAVAWSPETGLAPKRSALWGVDCSHGGTCTAVGVYSEPDGTRRALAVRYQSPAPPNVRTESATDVRATEATLKGTVNPEGLATTYRFEYGPTTSYGNSVPVPDETVGSGESDVEVSQQISGLSAHATYHFRIAATNSDGTTYGQDLSFHTSAWFLQSTPNPQPKIDDRFEDISCASPTMCLAVGKDHNSGMTFAAAWNGSEWETQLEEPSGFRMSAVSCESANRCLLIANLGTEYLKAKQWDPEEGSGSLWWSMPKPAGAQSVELKDVSCISELCTAVGSYVKESKTLPLAERGFSSWSIQTTANPESGSAALLGVSCTTSVACTAVGQSFGTGSPKSFAERWNGSSFSISTTPNPEGATSSKLNSVSCTTSIACTAVGSYVKEGKTLTLAERLNLFTWSIQTTANPGTGGAVLNGIICTGSSTCTAVGDYLAEGQTKPLIEAWSGGEWGLQSSSGLQGSLLGLSCTASSACTAAGHKPDGNGGTVTLAERWNGSSWSFQSTPNPQAKIDDRFEDISCASPTMCLAVGRDHNSGMTFAAAWNGSEWETQLEEPSGFRMSAVSCESASNCLLIANLGTEYLKAKQWDPEEGSGSLWWSMPKPAGAQSVELKDVSCISELCTAVGSYFKESKTLPLAERSNGFDSWSIQTTANPESGSAALLGVSCTTSVACTAVGQSFGTGSPKSFAERWNGSSWSMSSTLSPENASTSTLTSVSCTGATACTAVGNFGVTEEFEGEPFTRIRALVERWDGTSWSIQGIATPADAKGNISLSGVACTSLTSCQAVGSYGTEETPFGAGKSKTLVEVWNGSAWAVQTSPNPEGKTVNALAGISCSGPTACTAVGDARTSLNGERVTLAERYE